MGNSTVRTGYVLLYPVTLRFDNLTLEVEIGAGLMRLLLCLGSAVLFAGFASADQLVCTQPAGNTVIRDGPGGCTFSGPPYSPGPREDFLYGAGGGSWVWNGVFHADYIASANSFPENIAESAFPMSVSMTWNDSYALPLSKPTDLLRTTVTILGYNGEPVVHIGPDLTYSTGCDWHSSSFCPMVDTIPAAGVNRVNISGSMAVAADFLEQFNTSTSRGQPNYYDLEIDVSIERFLADGTTPDPFTTPEPARLGFVAGSLAMIFGFWRVRRSKSAGV